ncbi:hypothetical protein G7092_23320 [Mucilaginibacter sp. HC2]|uniref:hypothetical protein n=1 Tax=Mucilaginibacter inviolabilis TaxID=2714892 RepID=UPI0014095421|nr:hypothetical protein [Mucilaginibacter inviolabilis]NHA06754.1 hypothetical protein [Mucilaginibacter inviolabilis]
MKRSKLQIYQGVILFIAFWGSPCLLLAQVNNEGSDKKCFLEIVQKPPVVVNKRINTLLDSGFNFDIIRIQESGDYSANIILNRIYKVSNKWVYKNDDKNAIIIRNPDLLRLLKDYTDAPIEEKHIINACLDDVHSTIYTRYYYYYLVAGKIQRSLVSNIPAFRIDNLSQNALLTIFKKLDEVILRTQAGEKLN